MKKITAENIIFLVMALVILSAAIFAVINNTRLLKTTKETLPRVAKVGATKDSKAYLITAESMSRLKAQGFNHLFVTLNWTSDQNLVCMSHWDLVAPKVLKGFDAKTVPTLQQFTNYEGITGEKPCTLASLANWAKANSTVVLVTDFRADTSKALRTIPVFIKTFRKQIIPVVHSRQEIADARALGYEKVIFATYAFSQRFDNQVLGIAKSTNPYAILYKAAEIPSRSTLINKLGEIKVGVYASTLNDCNAIKKVVEQGADGVFTDSQSVNVCDM